MKRIFSLVVVLTMLFSALAMTANAADIKATLVVNGDDGKVGTAFTVDYIITGTSTLYNTQITLSYNKDVVGWWDAEYDEEVTASKDAKYAFTGSHKEDVNRRDTIWGQEVFKGDINAGWIEYTISASGSDLNDTVDLSATPYNLTADDKYAFTVITFNFVRKAEGDLNIKVAKEGDEVYNTGNPTGLKMSITEDSGNVVAQGLVDIVNPAAPQPPVVEDEFINDEEAIGGVKTITFAGRVGAEWMNLDYGVEFTANKEGTRAQRYYGAKDGDTVALDPAAGTTQVFTFGDWDGTFEIVLTNIAEAGNKEYKFFVGDNYTDAAIVVVE